MKPITRLAVLLAGALSLSACVTPNTAGPTASPFSSTSDAIVSALQTGCLPYLLEGGSIDARLKGHSARRGKLQGKPATLMYGNGNVLIREDERGACHLAASGVYRHTQVKDAPAYRQTVLDLIPRITSSPLVQRNDSGPGFNDPVGEFRQEGYCFTLNGKPAWLIMSSSTSRSVALQVSIGIDRQNICKDRLLPAA